MIAPVLSLTMLALLVAIVAVAAALMYAIRKGLQLWRDLKAALRGFGETMDELGRRVDALAGHEPPELGKLADSVARLRRSWAEFSVLRTALQRVRDQWAGLLAVYPRK
jgi:hypothetical protein